MKNVAVHPQITTPEEDQGFVVHVNEMDRHVTLPQQIENAGDGPVILVNKFD